MQAELDVIDSHSYWQHPHFAGRSWDPVELDRAEPPHGRPARRRHAAPAGLSRVAGKPFICTEYNHSGTEHLCVGDAANPRGLCRLQDWDGMFVFALFPPRRRVGRRARSPASSTSISTRTRWPPCRRRPRCSSAATCVAAGRAHRSLERIGGDRAGARAGPYLGADAFGVDRLEALTTRVGLDLKDSGRVTTTDEQRRDWTWGLPDGRKTVVIDTLRSKALIGDFTGLPFRLGDVRVAAVSTARTGPP